MDREPWPQPIIPALGADPIAHLERKRSSDPTVTHLITIRVFGGERDGDEVLVPLDDVRRALHRARRYRAHQWPDLPERPEILEQSFVIEIGRSPLPMRDGWVRVGVVGDYVAGPHWLSVWWHPVTNRVKVEQPPPIWRGPA